MWEEDVCCWRVVPGRSFDFRQVFWQTFDPHTVAAGSSSNAPQTGEVRPQAAARLRMIPLQLRQYCNRKQTVRRS